MARGRKSSKVKKMTHREVKLFKQLARTGLATREQAKEHCGISYERLQKIENSGYITLDKVVHEGKNRIVMQLSRKGKGFCKAELNVKSFATAQKNHIYHDVKLTELYYSDYFTDDQRENWLHENQLVEMIKEKHPDVKLETCVDAMVYDPDTDTMIAVESVGKSYDAEIMDLKSEIATRYLGCTSMVTA